MPHPQYLGHRPASGTEVDGHARTGQAVCGPTCQQFTLETRDVHPAVDPNVYLAELHVSGYPGQRFAAQAASGDDLEEREVSGRMLDEIVRFLLWREESGP